jgi:acyl carrier protein
MTETAGGERQALEEQVAGLVREVLQVDVASHDDDLLASGMLDSLAIVNLIAELEGVLGHELMLDEFDIDDFRTVGRIATFVEASRPAAGAA